MQFEYVTRLVIMTSYAHIIISNMSTTCDAACPGWEWNQLNASMRALAAVQAKCDRRKPFEVRNILERLIITAVNADPPKRGEVRYNIWTRVSTDMDALKKASAEFGEKRLKIVSASELARIARDAALMTQREPLPTLHAELVVGGASVIVTGPDGRKLVVPNIKHLIRRLGGGSGDVSRDPLDRIVACWLRYEAALAGGQQLGLPQSQHNALYAARGMRFEGFCSPLNSRMLVAEAELGAGADSPAVTICTLFEDTDACFGSIGPYWGAEILPGSRWSVNPPFVESIMDRAWAKIAAALDTVPNVEFVLLMPAWEDAASVRGIRASRHCRGAAALNADHLMQTPAGGVFKAGFKSILFTLANN